MPHPPLVGSTQPLRRARRGGAWRSALVALSLATAFAAGCPSNGPAPERPAGAMTSEAETFARLLDRYVDAAGNVDYAAWAGSPDDRAALDDYVDGLLAAPPPSSADPAAQLGYWIDLYNGIVLREIIARWPIASVAEIAEGPRGVDARGLFYDLTFEVGPKKMSLLDIETEIIRRRFADPRAHFALYCGTRSCPLLPGTPFSAGPIERRLDQATRAFVNHGGRVVIDRAAQRIAVSPVFGWYERDFIDFVRRRTGADSPTLVDFLIMHADAALARQLEAVRAEYEVALLPYDWRLNAIGAPDDASPAQSPEAQITEAQITAAEPMPDLTLATLEGGRWKPSDARGKVLLVDFWATWCRPCLLSFPHYARLQLAYERRGLEVVAVAEDASPAPVKAFAAAHRMAISIVLDPDNLAADPPLAVATLPTVLLVDRAGMVRYRHEGYSQPDITRLEAQIAELIAEPAPAPAP